MTLTAPGLGSSGRGVGSALGLRSWSLLLCRLSRLLLSLLVEPDRDLRRLLYRSLERLRDLYLSLDRLRDRDLRRSLDLCLFLSRLRLRRLSFLSFLSENSSAFSLRKCDKHGKLCNRTENWWLDQNMFILRPRWKKKSMLLDCFLLCASTQGFQLSQHVVSNFLILRSVFFLPIIQ